MRATVAREICARPPSGCRVEHDLAPRFEECLRERLLARPDARVYLRPLDSRAIRRDAALLERSYGRHYLGPPAQELDDDIGVVKDAAQPGRVRRVSRRSRLTYSSVGPRSLRSRHRPLMPSSVEVRASSCSVP